MAGIVGRVSGGEVDKEEWSIPYLDAELKGDPENGIKRYRLVFTRDGVWWDKGKTVNRQLSMSMVDVKTYARRLFGDKENGQ